MLTDTAPLTFVLTLLVAGCGGHRGHGEPARPRSNADAVQVSKLEPHPSCTFVRMVKGDIDDNYEELREDAADDGANYVVLDGMETSSLGFRVTSEMVGRAFRCPWAPASR